ncbi:MAG: multidrug transporter ATP-binding protein, partial [Bacilli bacterium]|nr:multidrug transporter ATP-binding protein [Bacilli bacterium]
MARNFDIDEEQMTQIDGAKFSRMLTYVSPYKWKMLGTMALMIIAVLSNQTTPYLIKLIIDSAIPNHSLVEIILIALSYLVIALIGWICTRGRIKIMTRVGQSILHTMRENLFTHIQKLSLRFYDSRPAGKIMARVTSDVNTINEVITDGVINMMTEFLNLVVIIAIMLSMNFKLALISMVTLPLLIGIGVTLRPRLHRLWHMTSARNSAITANLNE